MKMSIDEQLKSNLNSINVTEEQKQKLLERCHEIDHTNEPFIAKRPTILKYVNSIRKYVPVTLVASFVIFFILYTVQKDHLTKDIINDSGLTAENITNAATTNVALYSEESAEGYVDYAVESYPEISVETNAAPNGSIVNDDLILNDEYMIQDKESGENSVSVSESTKRNQTEILNYGTIINYENIQNCNFVGVGSIDFVETKDDIITITATATTIDSKTNESYIDQQITFNIAKEKANSLDLYATNNFFIFLLYLNDGIYATDSIQEPLILNNYNDIFHNELLDTIREYIITYWSE